MPWLHINCFPQKVQGETPAFLVEEFLQGPRLQFIFVRISKFLLCPSHFKCYIIFGLITRFRQRRHCAKDKMFFLYPRKISWFIARHNELLEFLCVQCIIIIFAVISWYKNFLLRNTQLYWEKLIRKINFKFLSDSNYTRTKLRKFQWREICCCRRDVCWTNFRFHSHLSSIIEMKPGGVA